MRVWTNKRGVTLVELLVASAIVLLLGVLVERTFSQIQYFYRRTSTASRQTAAATLALDKLQALCFGLPKQAIIITDGPEGLLMVVQPQLDIGPTGEPLYSSTRIVLENHPTGLRWWNVAGVESRLGAPLPSFPPKGEPSVRTVLEAGWRLNASFSQDRFPLTLTLYPPGSKEKSFVRTIPGYL